MMTAKEARRKSLRNTEEIKNENFEFINEQITYAVLQGKTACSIRKFYFSNEIIELLRDYYGYNIVIPKGNSILITW